MSRNNDYTRENLLYYLYHQKYDTLIGNVLLRQKNTSVPQKFKPIGKLDEENVFY